jgi:thiol-disulfide isomerase/thioredoxin
MRKIILTALLLLCALAASAQSAKKPALTLKDLNGRTFSLSDYKNKIVLLNFWATWCPPCRTEIPDLIKKQMQYRDQGLSIIGITYPPQKLTEVRRFVRKTKMNYRVAIGTKASKALFTSSETLPMTVVIDRDGTVRDVIEGVMFSDEFDEKVRPLLVTESARPVRESRLALHKEYSTPSPR